MKVLILNLLFLFSSVLLFSQITLTDGDGNPINNDDVRIYNTDGDEANLVVVIKKNGSSQIELKLRLVSITGANGSGMEFCFGTSCYPGISPDEIYPIDGNFYLDAGASDDQTHFHHHIQNGDPDATEYVLKIYERNNEAGNYVQFTYKYDANYVGINDVNKSSISIFPNPANDFININIPDNIKNPEILISNIIGKTIFKNVSDSSKNNINIKNLPSGIYFVSVISNGIVIDTEKLIKK